MNENINNEGFVLIYKKNSLMSLYLSQLLDLQGSYFRKGIINRDIIVSTLGDFHIIYNMDCDINNITYLLNKELGFQNMMDSQDADLKNAERAEDKVQSMTVI